MESIKLQIVTPSGLIFDDEVEEVELPTVNGEIGVLPQHISYIGLLGSGVLEYKEASTKQKSILGIHGGFCFFSNETLAILANSVEPANNLSKKDLQEKITNQLEN